MTIVTVDELINYMDGFKLTNAQRVHVDTVLLPGLKQDLEKYLNRNVEEVQVRERIEPDSEGYLYFSFTPVIEILSITRSDGTVVTIPDTYQPPGMVPEPGITRSLDLTSVQNGDNYRFRLDGYNSLLPSYSPVLFGLPTYIVEYISGFNGDVLIAMKSDIMRVAAREVGMWDSSVSIVAGQTEANKNPDDRHKGWTEEELAAWQRFRRRNII